jgi:hypothetical protein
MDMSAENEGDAGGGEAGAGVAAGVVGAGAGAGANTAASEAAGVADAASWFSSFDEDTRKMVETKAFKTPADLAVAYRGLEKRLGERPIGDPDPENLEAWAGWEKLGVPKDIADFKLTKPEMPEGLEFDDGLTAAVLAKTGKFLPPKVAQLMQDAASEYMIGLFQQNQEAHAKTVADQTAALNEEWGADADARTARAKQVFSTVFEGDVEALNQLEKVVGAPSVLRLLDKLGGMLGEDKLHVDPNGGAGVAAIQAQIDKYRADPDFMKSYNTRGDPDQKKNMAILDALYAKLPQDNEDDEG